MLNIEQLKNTELQTQLGLVGMLIALIVIAVVIYKQERRKSE